MNQFKEKYLPLIKRYWLMAVLGLIALLALPIAMFFSIQMGQENIDEIQKQVSSDYTAVTTSSNSYSLPGMAGAKVLEKKGEYNAELIAWYGERWKEVQAKTGVVWDSGLSFNKGEHELLVQGLFPEPPALEKDVKAREMVRAVIAFHEKLLKDANAGPSASAAELAGVLNEYRAATYERVKAERGVTELDAAEKEKLSAELVDLRLSRVKRHAIGLGVFATLSAFDIPREVSTKAPGMGEAWELQERSWVHADIMNAISKANAISGEGSGVPGGVVKRLVRVAVKSGGFDPMNPAPASYEAPENTKAPTDPARSLTGRISGPGTKNGWFDVRQVEVEVIISSQRLPSFIDALAAVNFVTVLDAELSTISVRDDLREGYFYGDEHVVKAKLLLETVWLREWRKDAMPIEVKKALAMVEGVVVESPGGSGGGARARPAPATPPTEGRSGGGGGKRGRED